MHLITEESVRITIDPKEITCLHRCHSMPPKASAFINRLSKHATTVVFHYGDTVLNELVLGMSAVASPQDPGLHDALLTQFKKIQTILEALHNLRRGD